MTLIAIVLATLAAGLGSVWVAAVLMRTGIGSQGSRFGAQHLLSLAAGALLATAFVHLLPEAFESHINPKALFVVLLLGLVFFFLLDKAELWHHGHEHRHALPEERGHAHDGHADAAHGHGHDHHHAHNNSAGRWSLLTGDSVHCFGDGILIASAFMADMWLGIVAAISVLAHEVPHHMGDLVVLSGNGSSSQSKIALLKLSLAGAVTALGGVVGYFLVSSLADFLPYFLAIASSSFIYVALADLIPQLQRQLTARQTVQQVVWLAVGMIVVSAVSTWAHGDHEHGHAHEGTEQHEAHEPHGDHDGHKH
ncbi:zinc and cadmium transporter [Comamonas sp. BIGb0152]|uniref:ZIP family metal transporter n=1 Tax=Comamonas sp. BIGb0152 TaxID=2940601 RepID=UPI0021693FCE|nr:ZIP family metal transporter [Comamonas sp. BIGb0152]MCS4292105.1 zinc and cadmium transporter [Comamonas sp. BIGb0152]